MGLKREKITPSARYTPNIKPFGERFDHSCLTVQRVHTFKQGCHGETFELHWKNVPCSICGGIHPLQEVRPGRVAFGDTLKFLIFLCEPCGWTTSESFAHLSKKTGVREKQLALKLPN